MKQAGLDFLPVSFDSVPLIRALGGPKHPLRPPPSAAARSLWVALPPQGLPNLRKCSGEQLCKPLALFARVAGESEKEMTKLVSN
jgi:hypothetical protein